MRFALFCSLGLACSSAPPEAETVGDSTSLPWLSAEAVRLDVSAGAHRMSVTGKKLEVDDELDLEIVDRATVEIGGSFPLKASADRIHIFGQSGTVILEGHVETRFPNPLKETVLP
jgi:hypothetical protein